MRATPWAAGIRTPAGDLDVKSVAQLPHRFSGKYQDGIAVVASRGGQTSVYLHKNPTGLVIGRTHRSPFSHLDGSTLPGDYQFAQLAAQRYGSRVYAAYGGSVLRFSSGSGGTWLDRVVTTIGRGSFVTDHSSEPTVWVHDDVAVTAFRDNGSAASFIESYTLDTDVLGFALAPPLNRFKAPQMWWFVKRPRGRGLDLTLYKAAWGGMSSGFEGDWHNSSHKVITIPGLIQVRDKPTFFIDRHFNGYVEVSIVGLRPARREAEGCTFALFMNRPMLTGLFFPSPTIP